MTTEPQPVPELDKLTSAAAAVKTAWEVREDEYMAALEQLEIDHRAKVEAIDANRDGFRKETEAWRKKAGLVYPFTQFLTPEEVAAKKFSAADSGGSVGKSERGVFEADPSIKIPASLQARVDGVLEWGAESRKAHVESLYDPLEPEPNQARLPGHYIDHLLYNIHWFGHFDSVLNLANIWQPLFKARPELWLTFNPLEQSLWHSTLTSSLYVLDIHADMDPRIKAAHKLLSEYFAKFEEDRLREEEAASKNYAKPGPGVHGKALYHPGSSDANAFEFRHLMWGKPYDREAADRIAGYLEAARNYVTAPDGKLVAVPSHGLAERYADQGSDNTHDFAHWSVYRSESASDEEIAALMGFKSQTPKSIAALSRLQYWCLSTQGGTESDVYSKDTGGGGLWAGKTDNRVVQFRDGSSVPGRWQLTKTGETQGVHSHQRGHTFAGSYRHRQDYPGWKAELEALDKRAQLGRHATRQALLSIEMGERL